MGSAFRHRQIGFGGFSSASLRRLSLSGNLGSFYGFSWKAPALELWRVATGNMPDTNPTRQRYHSAQGVEIEAAGAQYRPEMVASFWFRKEEHILSNQIILFHECLEGGKGFTGSTAATFSKLLLNGVQREPPGPRRIVEEATSLRDPVFWLSTCYPQPPV